jgi:choline dehydrogenase-like flavoprotein
MLVEGIAEGSTVETDLCIIGSGPAGLTVALESLGAGFDVLLLESGGRKPRRSTQRLAAGDSIGHPYYLLRRTRSRAFGGTTHYLYDRCGLRIRPLDDVDYEPRPGLEFSGWPFTGAEMAQYFDRAHTLLGLPGTSYGVSGFEGHGAERLGLAPDSDARTVLFHYAAKSHFWERHDEIAHSSNIRLALESTVVELITDGSSIERARVRSPNGKEYFVRARRFVVAGGGIDNPRLLLASRSGFPGGIGNENDLVGRFFTERLTIRSGVLHLTNPRPLPLYEERMVDGRLVQGMLALTEDAVRREGLFNFATYVLTQPELMTSEGVLELDTVHRAMISKPNPDRLLQRTGKVARWAMGLAIHPRRTVRARRPSQERFQLKAMVEQAPNPDSRIMLSDAEDALGMPRPLLDWRFLPTDWHTIARAHELLDDSLRQGGIGRIEEKMAADSNTGLAHGQRHHMGTTRMHVSPELGVVDANARVHTAENLYIAGSSVFPTTGYANPTLTILALSIRLADHLKSLFGGAGAEASERDAATTSGDSN